MTLILPEMMNLYVIASDSETITTIQGVGITLRDPGSFHRLCQDSGETGYVPITKFGYEYTRSYVLLDYYQI